MNYNIDEYKIEHSFPILYGTEKNNKTKIWEAKVFTQNNIALSEIKFGQLHGKMQCAYREYKEGKNIGKKNETTPYQQCFNETLKKWCDKKDKESYSEKNNDDDSKEENEKYFPMLAQTYKPNDQKNKKNDITFPCYVQPKLDGLRCIVYFSKSLNKIIFQSRTGSYFNTLEHINDDITKIIKINNLVLDGELYTTEMPFEELAGLIKKKKITDCDKEKLKNVKYHIYDIINNEIFEKRLEIINSIFLYNFNYVEKVYTTIVKTIEEFKHQFSIFVGNGYEGIILRNKNGLYRTNFRSHDLQKYKEFLEDEYEIIDFKEGDGRDKGTVIWICKTEEKNSFSVRPKGTIEYRKELYKNANKFIGKKLTVIFQELSELGIPRFPVGKCIRDGF